MIDTFLKPLTVSSSFLIFISMLFDMSKEMLPVFPFPGTPNMPLV